MYRREFMKLGGLLSVAAFAPIQHLGKAMSLPVEVESHGKLYRSSTDGKIYSSVNRGESWQLHTNFGTGFSIRKLATDLWQSVYVQLEFAGYSFHLKLAQNGKDWKTIEMH
jgi:hypothetical protein